MFALGLHIEALLTFVETEGIMISANGHTRLEPGEQEKFFRKPDGKIVMLVQPNCEAMGTVDLIVHHQRSEQHFGAGWPKGHPAKIDAGRIWDVFKGVPFLC